VRALTALRLTLLLFYYYTRKSLDDKDDVIVVLLRHQYINRNSNYKHDLIRGVLDLLQSIGGD